MSITSIQFVGLFVVIMNSGAGLHILLPHFPKTPFADHISAIQFDPNQVASLSWPGITSCGPDNSLRCAPVDIETITFSGALDPAPKDIVGDIPHLRCCCPSMTNILPKYSDPTATDKLSAHIFIERGVAEAIPDTNGRTDTWVTMHSKDTVGITVTAKAAASSSNIVFKPGAQFKILNSMPEGGDVPPHYLAYYLMGVGSSTCTALPSEGPPCAAQANECITPKQQSTKAVSRSSKPKSAARTPAVPQDNNADCSNSHWP